MSYQIKVDFVNEDTGIVSTGLLNSNIYETYALAMYISQHANEYDGSSVIEASNSIYVKQSRPSEYVPDTSMQYGSPEHIAFGDSWLYSDCQNAW